MLKCSREGAPYPAAVNSGAFSKVVAAQGTHGSAAMLDEHGVVYVGPERALDGLQASLVPVRSELHRLARRAATSCMNSLA